MVSGLKFSIWAGKVTPKEQANISNAQNLNQAEIAKPEGIQAIVNPAPTAVIMTLRNTDVGPQPANTATSRETQS